MQSQTLPSRASAPNLTATRPQRPPLTGCSTNRLSGCGGRWRLYLSDAADGGRLPMRELYVNICKYLYLWKIWLKIHTHSLRLWIMSQKSIGAGIHRSQMQSQTLLSRAYAPNLTATRPQRPPYPAIQTASVGYPIMQPWSNFGKQAMYPLGTKCIIGGYIEPINRGKNLISDLETRFFEWAVQDSDL